MKIGIVCYPTYGGSGVVATELGLGLAERGHEVHFISYSRPARLTSFSANVVHHEVCPPNYPLFEYLPYESALASRLVEVVLNNKLDILHVHYAIPHASVAYLAKKIALSKGKYIPVVTTLHGSDITLVGKDPSYRDVVEFSINKSDAITSVSEYLKDESFKNFDIHKPIEVIYNFIDLKKFGKSNKEHFRKAIAPDGELIVTHISNFRKVKRVKDVVRIFDNIKKRIPARLLMVGDGPERSATEALTRELGIYEDTRYLGKQEVVDEILSISDLFLMPSENESFGLAALEAFACGVPVVSSDIGGLPELNIDGRTGYLCEVGNIADFSAKSIMILENETLKADMMHNAYNRAKDFDIDLIIPQYESLYLRTIRECVQEGGS